MKDVRIVVVSWNVEKLLDRCLRSLREACGDLDWECIVVDNASKDSSTERVRKISEEETRISLIANFENVGFAKACNQGARGSDSRYVLYLNPDTECPRGSIAELVQVADRRLKTAIFGPRLVYRDGRHQASIRRFPDVWSQAGILLKLHHLFPRLRCFQSYFAKDLDPEQEQTVDQVMGACFLVRREFLDATGGFDERYFIWFEEVDWCRTAKEKGWEVRYLPHVRIMHHGGESFGQVFNAKKQQYYNDSLITYFRKWHPKWQGTLLSAIAPVAIAESWIIGLLKNPVGAWAVFTILLEAVSALTIFRPVVNSLATFVLGVVVLLLGWKHPVTALGILLLELLIGSKGQLLQFGVWPVTTSLRIILTGSFLLGWFISIVQDRGWIRLWQCIKERRAYILLFALIVYAFVRGRMLENGTWVQNDANAWADWALFFPIVDIAKRYPREIRRLVPVFFVGLFWLAVKTLGLEYLFSHGFTSIAPSTYLWVRRTGVGEVTLVVGNAFRIFMQSYIYATAGWIMAAAWWLGVEKKSNVDHQASKCAWWVMLAATFLLAVSLSRSLWIGTASGFMTLAILYSRERIVWWKRVWGPISAKIAAVLLLGVVLAFPLPNVKMASLVDLFGSRTNLGEAAAVSRWSLISVLGKKIAEHSILGSGFGATVTYKTADPRILREHPDGMYTTYAFEWGWLEHWIKFGILGIPLILWLLVSLGWRLWRLHEPLWFRAGAVSSIVALGVLHVFTPYLNHPLGFLYLFVGEAIVASRISPPRISS